MRKRLTPDELCCQWWSNLPTRTAERWSRRKIAHLAFAEGYRLLEAQRSANDQAVHPAKLGRRRFKPQTVPFRWRTTVGSKSIAGDAGHNLVAVTFLGC